MPRRTLLFVSCENADVELASTTGIGVYAFEERTRLADRLSAISDIGYPFYLAFDPATLCVYATSEVAERETGLVVAYALDPVSGILTHIGNESTLGSLPCHLSFDLRHDYLFVSNFDRGIAAESRAQGVAVLPIRRSKGLGPAVSSRQHQGAGPLRPNQDCPHAHCALASADNRFVIVTDLGTDEIVSYSFDEATGLLGDIAGICRMPPGSGPRYLAFAGDGRTAFVSNELNSTVAILNYDPEAGFLETRQILSSLPEGVSGPNYPADIHLGPDGRFLYVSNRGHDSIAVFRLHNRGLISCGYFRTNGEWPRSFAISPDGAHLLVANQRSHQVVVFDVDPDSGALARAAPLLHLRRPVFVTLASIETETSGEFAALR